MAKWTKNNPVLPIFVIVLVDILSFTIILPLLPFYTLSLGASPFVIGLLVSVFGFCQFVSGPVLGHISDKWGRKPVLLISQLGTLSGLILLAISRSLTLVFLARIIDGITAGNITVAQAYIADVTPPEKRAKSFGILGSAFGLGMLIGPALSGFLAHYGNACPIWAAVFLSALSIVGTTTLLSHTRPEKQPLKPADQQLKGSRFKGMSPLSILWKYMKVPALRPLLFQHLCFTFAFMTFVSGLALFCLARFTWHGHPFGAEQTGYVFTYAGIIGLTIQAGLIHWLITRLGAGKLIVFGFLSMFVGYGILSGVYVLPVFVLCLTLNNFGSSVLRPAIMSEVSKRVPRTEQGAIMGVIQAIQSLSQVVAPLVSGLLINRGWFAAWSWTSSLVSAVGLASAIWARRQHLTTAAPLPPFQPPIEKTAHSP
jgi:MFS family permease